MANCYLRSFSYYQICSTHVLVPSFVLMFISSNGKPNQGVKLILLSLNSYFFTILILNCWLLGKLDVSVLAKEEDERRHVLHGRYWNACIGSKFAATICIVKPLP